MVHVCVVPTSGEDITVSAYLIETDCLNRIARLVEQLRPGFLLCAFVHDEERRGGGLSWDITVPAPAKRSTWKAA